MFPRLAVLVSFGVLVCVSCGYGDSSSYRLEMKSLSPNVNDLKCGTLISKCELRLKVYISYSRDNKGDANTYIFDRSDPKIDPNIGPFRPSEWMTLLDPGVKEKVMANKEMTLFIELVDHGLLHDKLVAAGKQTYSLSELESKDIKSVDLSLQQGFGSGKVSVNFTFRMR